MDRDKKETNLKGLAPLVMVVVLAVASVWPVIKNPAAMVDIGQDGYLITWIINQSGRNLMRVFSSASVREFQMNINLLFNGNIFYPNNNVLTYSDAFFITGLWTYMWGQVGQNPGIVAGLALAGGQVGTMILIYLWWKEITRDGWAAAVGSVALGLSVVRWHYQVHLQMWGMQWWLSAVYLFWKWKQTRKTYLLIGSGVVWGLLFWESLLTAVFTGAVIAVMSWKSFRRDFRNLVVMAVIGLVVAMPILVGYYKTSLNNNLTRSIREAAHNSLAVDELGQRFNSPGLYILVGVGWWIIKRKKVESKDLSWLVGVMLVGLVMSLGPVLKWNGQTVKIGGRVPIPLPYTVAYYGIPGFGAFRTPSRWIWLAAFAGSGIAAIAVSRVTKRKVAVTVACLAVAIVGGGTMEPVKKLPGYRDFPEVYQWFGEQSKGVVLELPMGDENVEAERMYYSLGHKMSLVNGYSGFYPEDNLRLKKVLAENRDTKEIRAELNLREVTYLVIHKEFYKNSELVKWEKMGGNQKVWENENTEVFKL